MDALIEDTSERTRAALESWPAQEVGCEGFLDGDGLNYDGPIRIVAKVKVVEGMLDIDLTGSDPQVAGPVNIPWASTHAAAFYVARCFLGERLRQNHGFTRHVRISAPPGTIVNPRLPAAVVSRHLGVQRLSDVLFQALSDLLPDRAMASSHVSFPGMSFRAWRRWGPAGRTWRQRD
jgi:N-methylhydantoinase B